MQTVSYLTSNRYVHSSIKQEFNAHLTWRISTSSIFTKLHLFTNHTINWLTSSYKINNYLLN